MSRRASKHGKLAIIRQARGMASRDSREAVKIIDNYLSKLNRPDLDLLILKGNILDSASRFDDAKKTYEQILRLDPTNAPALIDLGDYYSNSKSDFRKALRYYDRAFRLLYSGGGYFDKKGEFIDACTEKAAALIQLKKPLDAMKCVISGLQRYPASRMLFEALQRAREQYETLENGKRELRSRKT
jgi:tetratricopeptide (TPR) repeat protein